MAKFKTSVKSEPESRPRTASSALLASKGNGSRSYGVYTIWKGYCYMVGNIIFPGIFIRIVPVMVKLNLELRWVGTYQL